MVRWSDRIVGKCGLCHKSVRRRDSVTVYRHDPTERLIEIAGSLAPRLMTAHADCWARARIRKHERKLGRALSEDERDGLMILERGLGPVEIENGGIMATKATTKAKAKTAAKGGGFKDGYDESGAPQPDFPPFVTADQKAAMAESGERLKVTAIRIGESKHGQVFHLDVEAKSLNEPGTLTFSYDGKVAGRDYMLEHMADWSGWDKAGASVPIQIVKQGRTYVIELL